MTKPRKKVVLQDLPPGLIDGLPEEDQKAITEIVGKPVLLESFAIRRGSGGTGQFRGGEGVIRRIEFLQPLTLSILSQRRGPYPPYGLGGGKPGALGQNSLHHADGNVENLPALVQAEVQPGDVLTIETPGGGGYGEPG